MVINLVKLQVEVRKASNKAVKMDENLPILKILGVMNDRPFLPVSLHSGLEFSTIVQGGYITEEDFSHLPHYLRQLISQVFLKRASPSAIQKVSVANATLNKSKLSLMAQAKQTVITQNGLMAKNYKRKFREHCISVERVNRFKAASGKIGNPKISKMIEPTSYQQ